MRGYFDDDEPEMRRPGRDTELTLGAGALFGLFFALVLLCALCFGAGYLAGHRGPVRSAAAAPTAAPDQEPLQGSVSIPKPSAADTSSVPAPPAPNASAPSAAPADGATPAVAPAAPAANSPAGSGSPALVQPALPGAAGPRPPAASPGSVRAALPAQPQFLVQIASVANVEDARVLVTALRNHGYSVTATREPADGLIHVRIGPFATRNEADRWRDKLLGDGYNAQVQP